MTSTVSSTYFPPTNQEWERRTAVELGVDAAKLQAAVQFAEANEINWSVDISQQNIGEDAPELSARLGHFKPRGGPAGVVLKSGYIVAEWGDLDRVDLTYSATKSYVATTAGLAFDRGLIKSVDDPVCEYERDVSIEYTPAAVEAIERLAREGEQNAQLNMAAAGVGVDRLDSAHNAQITWRHLLQLTSEWEGWLFGKPDTVDWNRGGFDIDTVRDQRKSSGTHWEYNDVRVNRTALAVLSTWGESLPGVLKREVMDPIGASDLWEWHGYDEYSTVLLNGKEIESVSGGAHWGGGMWINTYDHARFGLLFLNRGNWNGKRIISDEWVEMMTEPCLQNPSYGFMWWLNTGHERYGATASERTFAAMGAGGNSVVCDPERDLVVVTRWCEDVAGVIDRIAQAVGRGMAIT